MTTFMESVPDIDDEDPGYFKPVPDADDPYSLTVNYRPSGRFYLTPGAEAIMDAYEADLRRYAAAGLPGSVVRSVVGDGPERHHHSSIGAGYGDAPPAELELHYERQEASR
jgi:hypothetical protein